MNPAGETDQATTVHRDLELRLTECTAQLASLREEADQFAHWVSHELRGPLMHIGGFADLLQEHAGARLDEKGRQYLRTVINSTDQLGRLLGEILSYSRLSRVELQLGPVDLDALVEKVKHELDGAQGDRKVVWQVEIMPNVTADAPLLRQAVTKLVANALKFTKPRDEALIQIGTLQQGSETVVFFRDNGVGFEPAQQDKLFGVFQRLHAAADFPGSGLGLASVRRIIQRHGGRTWAEGRPGEGATFYFSLPSASAVSNGWAV